MRYITRKTNTIVSLGLILAMLAVLIGLPLQIAQAAAITGASNIMSSSRAGALSNHDIRFTSPTGAAVSQTVTITLPAGFALAAFAAVNYDIATAPAGCTVWTERPVAATAGVGTWGISQPAGQVVTLTAPTDVVHLAAGNCLRVRIGNNATFEGMGINFITNPATGSHIIAIAGTFGNTGNITVSIIPDDRVAVSSIVGQTITFSLAVNTLALGTLSATAATGTSHAVTLATNAASGMAITYAGATLTSGAHTIAPITAAGGAPSAPGTSQFGINLVANTAPSVGAACSGTAPIAAAVGGYNTVNNFRFVTGDSIVSSAGAINSTTCTISYIANIAGLTPAGTYTTTLTYTATPTF